MKFPSPCLDVLISCCVVVFVVQHPVSLWKLREGLCMIYHSSSYYPPQDACSKLFPCWISWVRILCRTIHIADHRRKRHRVKCGFKSYEMLCDVFPWIMRSKSKGRLKNNELVLCLHVEWKSMLVIDFQICLPRHPADESTEDPLTQYNTAKLYHRQCNFHKYWDYRSYDSRILRSA
jgi:hypothetical protein